MIHTVLFDLDGTLLPMDQEVFVKSYFGLLAKKLAPLGYDSQALVKVVWKGVAAMTANTGEITNEELFWQMFVRAYGEEALKDKDVVLDFYENEFNQAQNACGFNPMASSVIDSLKKAGKRVILATNPLFPRAATLNRIRWAGLNAGDFELITTYEDNRFCKPNLDYYRDILKRQNLKPSECLMVGNSVSEDMAVQQLGMKVFLLTDCLINEQDEDISGYPKGDFDGLQEFLDHEVIGT